MFCLLTASDSEMPQFHDFFKIRTEIYTKELSKNFTPHELGCFFEWINQRQDTYDFINLMKLLHKVGRNHSSKKLFFSLMGGLKNHTLEMINHVFDQEIPAEIIEGFFIRN